MPLERMLEEAGLDPNATAPLLEVFDGIVEELGLRTGPDRRKAAKIVLNLACSRSDLVEIRQDAIRKIRREGMGRRRPF
jgi:hypothetical protein